MTTYQPSYRAAPAPPAALPRLLATAGDPSLAAHYRRWGPAPGGGPDVLAEIDRSGLVGRGGAGFPTARKMAAVAARRGAVVVVNATEGEPASRKDKVLLTQAPHLVLDGAVIAAQTVGATEAIICIDRQATLALQVARHALSERISAGVDLTPLRIEASAPGYVSGEESALVNWLNGGPPRPTYVPPRPFERGVAGRPTLVNNAETLAHVALIARHGSAWFRSLGTPQSSGTALVTVAGDVAHPGVFEIALGTPMRDIVTPAGLLGPARAALLGGYAGTWVSGARLAKLTFDQASLRQAGAFMGCGSVIVAGERSCGLAGAAAVARWMAGESAGQCGPCVHGLPAVAEALEKVLAGDSKGRWLRQLERLLGMVDGRGACKHPDGVVRMVRSALTVFRDDMGAHRSGACRLPATAMGLPGGRHAATR
jgi:NADH:ubiquinone oxidoreductase subunit F (NADH-binding)